jgi:phosphonate transport system substrate-binding protein
VHAFSDPNSNSGYLVTTALLAEKRIRPEHFFSRVFFTYGHRNVVRAVAAALADSGSVDGYVWEVMKEIEPDLTDRTRIVRKSEWLGFPPIATPRGALARPEVRALQQAFIRMPDDPPGAIRAEAAAP